MANIPRWRRYLRFFGANVQGDVDDELAFHMEMRIRDYESHGMSRPEAERAARERIGDVVQVHKALAQHDAAREQRLQWGDLIDRFRQDLVLALRGFRRTPGFFLTAILILGVGIGGSAAMYTILRSVLLQKLPVRDENRLVVMWTYREPGIEFTAGTKSLATLRRESRTLQDVAGTAHWGALAVAMIDGRRTLALNRGMTTGNYFDVIGARPALGRLYHQSDDDVGTFNPSGKNASKVLVLSYAAWRNKFGGDSSVIGRKITEPLLKWDYTVIGVAPAGLSYPAGVDYWIPIWGGWVDGPQVLAVGRLAPGATIEGARDEYFNIESRERPNDHFRGATAKTFRETVLGDTGPTVAILSAAVGLLLLIACLNIGNLLLLRLSGRSREIAVRRALGATHLDIVAQLAVEAIALALVGGVIGLGIAVGLLRAFVLFAPPTVPRIENVQLSGAPVLATLAVSLASALLFGILPALFAAPTNLAAWLRLDSRSGSDTHRRRHLRQILVASQVALAVIMLAGAALLARSLERLERQAPGYVSEHLAILTYAWDATRYDSVVKMLRVSDALATEVEKIHGVTAATPIVIPPLLGKNVWQWRFDREGQSPDEAAANPLTPIETGGPDFFKTFGIPITRGRAFTADDRENAAPVLVVSESVARRYWPGQDPIGKRLRTDVAPEALPGGRGWRTVVGVTADTHLRSIRETAPTIYLPWRQSSWQGYFAIRTTVDLPALLPALRRAGAAASPDLILWRAQTMDELLAQPLAQPRLGTLLMSTFGLAALLLAAIGLYGVMASVVRDQTREIGIRIALGASAGRVRRDVLTRAAMVVGSGALVGLITALASSRVLSSLLFEVSPTDPLALGGACLVLLVIGALAAYLPARRATRIDPVQALRAD